MYSKIGINITGVFTHNPMPALRADHRYGSWTEEIRGLQFLTYL